MIFNLLTIKKIKKSFTLLENKDSGIIPFANLENSVYIFY